MEYTYTCKGTCSRNVTFSLSDEHIVTGVTFTGGCSGNTQGVGILCEGAKAEELIARLKGIRCGFKNTSCPDQLATALEEALEASAQV